MTAPVAELMPVARALAASRGQLPSIRALMTQLRIGQPKAKEIRAGLIDEVHRTTSKRGRIHAGRTMLQRHTVRRGISVSGTLVSPGLKPADPWSHSVPVQRPEAPRLSMETPAGEAVAPRPSGLQVATWPIFLLALPAFVAIWSGWVDLGRLTGFGVVHLLPGILDNFALDTAITLPVGLETYAAYALYVWLSAARPGRARDFAKWSAIGSLALGAAGQVAYHLMVAAGMDRAPWQITTIVACLPVAVLGMGAALRHLVHGDQ